MAHRLHLNGTILSYQRGQRTLHQNFCLVEIDGVSSLNAAKYYLGKTVFYAYKVKKTETNKKGLRLIRGRIVKTHGNSGAVRVRFTHNLPPTSFGKPVRVQLYPQH
ncbi:putative 60S ribosomal protein L35a [Blattamonas nauphoetae]|uniref:60S ribosomal protein L35a n=1 Tax=Blattamonas nauphoetae TaxID=2049346 RepID=A0ABQ9YG07_9EUKA|nr:putative 60S ribosomal protein L35a [Blattamonas nauphoetae]